MSDLPSPDLSQVLPIGRDTMHDRVHVELCRLLMAGAFPPGAELSLRMLARRLGVSEMPVREATGRLIADGALQVTRSRKVVVPWLGAARFEELRSVRTLLEGEAVRLACGRIDAAGLAALCELQRRLCQLRPGEEARYLELNRAFHFAIYVAAGRPLLVSLIEKLWLQAGPTLAHIPVRLGRDDVVDRHGPVLAALERGDASAARDALEADLASAARRIVPVLAERGPEDAGLVDAARGG